MRKPLAISLLIVYIIFSSGVAVRAYYNSGKLTSINLILDRSSEKASPVAVPAKDICKGKVAATRPAEKSKPASASLKAVLNCVTVVSQGFFEAYDVADTTPDCNACASIPRKADMPHMVSID